jgi:hypothetical protein
MSMGDKIAYLINVLEGGNRSEFSRKIGIKNTTSGLAHDWMTGRCRPKGSYRLKICEVYGVSIEWLQNDDLPVSPPIMAKEPVRHKGDDSAVMAELRAQIEDLKKDKEDLKRDKEDLKESVKSLLENNRILAEAAGKKIGSGIGVAGVRSKVRG